MGLQTLLGEMKKQRFAADYLHRLPLSMPGTARELCRLGTWDVLEQILADESPTDLMVVRSGQRSAVAQPGNVTQARELCHEGHTIVVRHAERHHRELQDLAESFVCDLQAPVNVHMYVTPPGSHGFSWHYDAEDVFIIQTAGAKQYSLRKNTVNPWPLEETIPADMRYEREMMPLMRAELWPGDWLYIPCGYWHQADASASEEAAISLAVGVMSRSAMDVFDVLRARLLDSMLWRQRLPITGDASPLDENALEARYTELFGQLADDLTAALRSPSFLRTYRAWARDRANDST